MELTPEQLRIVADRSLLAAKGEAGRIIGAHLRDLAERLRAVVRAEAPGWVLPDGFDPSAFQVARGENLDGLPYNYLDCPRFFSRDAVVAFRVLVWWGRFVGACWILKGDRLAVWRERLLTGGVAVPEGLGCWVGADPWDWNAFAPLAEVDHAELAARDFLKFGVCDGLTREALSPVGIERLSLGAFEVGRELLRP